MRLKKAVGFVGLLLARLLIQQAERLVARLARFPQPLYHLFKTYAFLME
jgi:hypothetical protein